MTFSSTLGLLLLAVIGEQQTAANLNNAYYDGAVCIANAGSFNKFIGLSREMDDFCGIQFDIKMVTEALRCDNELCFALKNTDSGTNHQYLSIELFLSDRITASARELWYIEPTINSNDASVNIFAVVPNRSQMTLLCSNAIASNQVSIQTELRFDNRVNRGKSVCQWKLQLPTKGSRINIDTIATDTTDSTVGEFEDTEVMKSRSNSRPVCIAQDHDKYLGLGSETSRLCGPVATRWNQEGYLDFVTFKFSFFGVPDGYLGANIREFNGEIGEGEKWTIRNVANSNAFTLFNREREELLCTIFDGDLTRTLFWSTDNQSPGCHWYYL